MGGGDSSREYGGKWEYSRETSQVELRGQLLIHSGCEGEERIKDASHFYFERLGAGRAIHGH